MKKTLIIVIILLIILMFGQLIYYKINPKRSNISSSDQIDDNPASYQLYIKGMATLYNDYNPGISFENLENNFYVFVFETVEKIYNDLNNKSIEEIRQYYNQNIRTINSMNIYTEDDFVMIAYQINNVFDQYSIIDLYNYNVDTDTISKTQDGSISFKVNLLYDNEKQIQVLYTISENDDSVTISSGAGLDEVFKTYSGEVTKQEVLNKIDTFISNIKDLRLYSTLKTENERRQYFDLNEEKLNNIGITSQDDYVGIVIQINAMRWRESDLQFESFEINPETIINREDYLSFELMIYYNYDSSLHLKVSISNQKSVTPNIKISSYENE